MNGQIQDDDEESKENHEGRRKEKRDLKIPRKRKKVKMMVSDLLERVEEKDQTRKDKEFCIEQFLEELEREKREKLQQHQRLSEVEEEKENLSVEVRNLVRVLNERDQNLSLANEELEKKSASVSRLQNYLRRLQSESQNLQAERDMSKQQLSEKEVDFRGLQANLDKKQQERQRLEEELLQSKRTCAELERGLENERSFSQSNQQAAETKEKTRKEHMRELKLVVEGKVRGLHAEVDEGRVRKRLHVRKEERPLTKQKKKASPANSVVEEVERHVSSNSQDKPLVLHVSTVKIGDLVGKATAPVKLDAEEIFIKMETNEGNSCKNISYQFRILCKDLSECKVNFDAPPFVLVLKPTTAGLSSILGKCKEKGKFLDPESQDANKRYIVLVLDYKVIRRVKADLTELFQSHLAGPLKWIELSSKQAQECLDTNEETRIAEEEPSTQSPKPPSLANKDQSKILTPIKGRNTGKKLFVEENKSSPSDASSSIATTNNEPSRTEQPKLTKQTGALGSTIVTQSRRRKSPDVVNSNTEEPVPNCAETVKPDTLRHHKEIESPITLLEQHSKEQRQNLQQHQRLLREVEEKKERNPGRMGDLEITYSADKERLLERIRDLEGLLNEKDQALTLANEELEKERASVSRSQNEIEKEREANLKRLQSELQDTQAARNMLEQQFSEKESNFRANLGEEQQARQRLEEELLQSRRNCTELARSLEKERLLSQSNQKAAQTKEETIREQMRQLEQERGLKLGLQETVRGLQAEVEEERTRRVSTERELLEERNILQQNRENLERERETYVQRIRESERRLVDSERRLGELQSAVSVAEEPLAVNRRREPRDWIIQRDEVVISEIVLGTGAWGKVYKGKFRGCQVAVKQIHELILSPHNRRLFEREMSIASRCRHPNLLQFMGATNDDGNALFVTELLDTDLRKVFSQRPLHHGEIVCLAWDVALALNYLHLNKPFPIIHRDISSSNVLLWRRDDRWRAKLSDYGAANFMRQCMTSNPGASIYAAPEALTSKQSPKVDVYSFGVLLCEMCIRELPDPQGIQEQIGLVKDAVLRELVRQCVMRAPGARPTMNDVITLLTQQAETLNAQGLMTLRRRTAIASKRH